MIPRRLRVPKGTRFTKPPGCSGCSMEHKGLGFCPDLIRLPALIPSSGITPVRVPKLTVWARDPGTGEILKNPPEPLSGPSGFMLNNWVLPRADIEMAYSKCNTIRCHTPDDKYPTGKMRKSAEKQCRQYDQLTPDDHDVILVTLHPASIMHNKFDPLPLIISDFMRAKMLLDRGLDVLVLMGGEAMDLWAPHLRHSVKGDSHGITDWRGHFWPTPRFSAALLTSKDDDGAAFFNNLFRPHCSFYAPTGPQGLLACANMFGAECLALDLEWNPADPTTITRVGLVAGEELVCTFAYDDSYNGTLQLLLDSAQEIVMHSGLGAGSDADMLERAGLYLDPTKVRDSQLGFHLIWPQFAGHGFLSLWTFASMHSNTPNWKICRGERGVTCFGACPVHDPVGYNALDAQQTWIAWQSIKPELILRGQL